MRISNKDVNVEVKEKCNSRKRKAFKFTSKKSTAKKKPTKPITEQKYKNYIPKQNLLETKVGRKTMYYWSNKPDVLFDAEGEAFVYIWLLELQIKGYIDSIELQPEPFTLSEPIKRTVEKQLKTKVKIISEHVESSQIYTADFKVTWTAKAIEDNLVIDFHSPTKKEPHHIFAFEGVSYFEAKPDPYNMKIFDSENMIRLFRSKQKEVFSKFGIYINLVFHNKLFHTTFMPARYTFANKSLLLRGIRYEYKTFDEYIEYIKPKEKTLF